MTIFLRTEVLLEQEKKEEKKKEKHNYRLLFFYELYLSSCSKNSNADSYIYVLRNLVHTIYI